MICYRDMTFCPYSTCANFGDNCHRSLTEDVLEAAEKWWNPKGEEELGHAPIAMYAVKPECYGERDETNSDY